MDYAVKEIPEHLLQLFVCDVVDSNGQWAWGIFQTLLPLHILVHIAANKPPSAYDGDDEMYWSLSKSRKFTIASSYNLLAERDWPNVLAKWKVVWD